MFERYSSVYSRKANGAAGSTCLLKKYTSREVAAWRQVSISVCVDVIIITPYHYDHGH